MIIASLASCRGNLDSSRRPASEAPLLAITGLT